MVRPLDADLSGIAVCDLSYAERLGLWSLRQMIRREPPRCRSHADGLAWGHGDELHRIDDAFRVALNELATHTMQRLRVDYQASLRLSGDEVLLLRCLAGLQQDRHSAAWSLVERLPHARANALFLDALQALAATLGACGYWLTDVAEALQHSVAASPVNARQSVSEGLPS